MTHDDSVVNHTREHGEHSHEHREHSYFHGGRLGLFQHLFMPHSHDAANSVDAAMESSARGIRVLWASLVVLLATSLIQLMVVLLSGSVALLADTVHNFSDALTAVPLWIAFVVGRRVPTKRFTYGFGRAEDLAGIFIVLVVAASAVAAAWQSIDRLVNPQPMQNAVWVLAAGVIGFLGNESVAIYRVRVGRQIGSAALVADGVHARTDAFTSLAVVLGALGSMLGFPLADPIVGLLISVSIFVLLVGTIRTVGSRLLDGIDPMLVRTAERTILDTPGVLGVCGLRLRWIGHKLDGDAVVLVADMPLSEAGRISEAAERSLARHLKNLGRLTVSSRAKEAEPEHAHPARSN